MMMPNVTQIDWTFKITSISQCFFPRFPCENYETLLLKEERQQKKRRNLSAQGQIHLCLCEAEKPLA